MRISKLLLLAVAGAAGGSALVTAPLTANAQDSTSGAIAGVVKDKSTGEALDGVTVVITSNKLQGQRTAITEGGGRFKITTLPPGYYTVKFYFGEAVAQMNEIRVSINATQQLYPKMDTSAGGEVVTIKGRPNIDTTKTRQGIVVDREFTRNLPVPGRTFEATIESAAGAQDDGVGISFSGSSSLENQYVVDGVNTTGLSFGTVGSPVINEFVEEIEVITGGYMAEHGRSTGGVVNVVTQSGTNDFHGTVFTQFTNSALQKRNERAPIQAWIDIEQNLAYDLSLGASLGGPIIKDKLWFFVGLAPRLIAVDTERITKRQTDCREVQEDGTLSDCVFEDTNGDGIVDSAPFANGEPDEDENGFLIYDELDRDNIRSQATEYQFVSKINYSPTPEHSGQFTFNGTPFTQQTIGIAGEPQAVSRDAQVLTTDLAAKWTSKFNNGKTTVEGVVGVHRSTFESGSIDPNADDLVQERLLLGNFGTWANGVRPDGQPRESMATRLGCNDSNDFQADPYQFIDNCPDPGVGYSIGGIGFLGDNEEQRTSGRMNVTQRVEAAGNHEVKAGVDFESNFVNKKRLISGNAAITNLQDRSNIQIFRFIALAPQGEFDAGRFDDLCGRNSGDEDPVACDHTPPGDVRSRTINTAAYLQDSWQILPNLTLNAGIRYEEQRLRNAENLQDTMDPNTGEFVGKNAMVLGNMWAPRLGLSYDWTKEGRSKIYGSFGRYYESIPMNINDRSFGGESFMRSTYDSSDAEQCGNVDPNIGSPSGLGCLASGSDPALGDQVQGAGTLVASGIQAQFLDEAILGVEYEVMEDLKVSLAYQNRRLGRVLEDVSTDNAATYVIANPGEWSEEEEDKLLDKIANETDPAQLALLNNQLRQFRGIRNFDKPTRDYNSVTLSAQKRFSRQFYVQGSYTYSRTEGNYQGLFSSNNGQVDPNITSLFDLEELMANRNGPLPQDRPHLFKVDGYYTFDFQKAGELTTGMSFRGLSGIPINATGAHYLYGFDETFVLPRGSLGRVDFNYDASIHVGYGRELGKGMKLEGFVDFFNLVALTGQRTASVDETYTLSNVNPVVGGDYSDLVFLKQLEQGSGADSKEPARRNRNFLNPRGLYGAPAARLGARLTF